MRALSGEEQGLYGGKVIADYAKAQGWNVIADLNNDIIGNSCGSDGVCDSTHVRVLSEGPRSQGQAELPRGRTASAARTTPVRNISRFLDSLADRLKIGLDVRQIWRNDRFGRGGDHTEFLKLGFPAARITRRGRELQLAAPGCAGRERHQATATRSTIWISPISPRSTKLNIAALAAIASAPPPPEPKVEGAVSTDTTVTLDGVPERCAT